MRIWIDAGHGGVQPGNVALGRLEKDLTLDISLKLAALLRASGHTVGMTRTTDVDVGIDERARLANKWGADLFISIHLNGGGGYGAEVFCSLAGGKSRELAAALQTELVSLGYRDRGVKTKEGNGGRDYFGVIRETNAPAVIAECGFLDSRDDMARYNADKIADALAKGVAKYTGVAYKPVAAAAAPGISGLSLDTSSKDLTAGAKYTVLARCREKPTVATTGRDVIAVSEPRLDPKGRGWLIDVEGLPPEPVVRHGHITVSAAGQTAQCNFNVK